jgi:hypothetical protein
MKPKPLSEFTTEELIKNEKGMRIIVIVMGVCVGFMFLSGGYLFVKKGFSASTALPLCFMPLWILNYRNWKKLKEELAKRG